MHGFPLECIPSDLRMENLVALDMSYSNIKSFDLHDSSLQPLAKRQKRLIGSCSKDKRSLGSLKILDLSFCEQLRSLGGFSELPSLERLIVTNCIRLVKVCESVEQCAELSLINLSYCYNLEKLPTSLRKLKKVKTLLVDGCDLQEPPVEMRCVDSQEMVRAINSQEFSCAAIPSKLKFLATFLPSSLVRLSLKNNNLSNESFPTDFSSLSMLKELNLDGNPIISMPTCVKSLPRLEELSMNYTNLLVSVEHPPPTLKELYIAKPVFGGGLNSSLRKIVLDPEMSTLKLAANFEPFKPSSIEVEGIFKSQTICRRFDVEIVTEPIGNSLIVTYREFFDVPSIKISNVTKNIITWIYNHLILGADMMRSKFIIFLSHWMFGANEMEAGDQVTITVTHRTQHDLQLTEECGFSLVYDDDDDDYDDFDGNDYNNEVELNVEDDGRMKEEEVPLSDYKTWNNIIGKDLSAFQSPTGEYILQNKRFSWDYVYFANHVYYGVPDAKNSIG
ncbi:disease resistance protein RML1B-like protein [Tanacetum coccineum]